jgi:hypothetical protein
MAAMTCTDKPHKCHFDLKNMSRQDKRQDKTRNVEIQTRQEKGKTGNKTTGKEKN